MLRKCLDCPTLTTGSRCRPCELARSRARPTRQQRGYGFAHDHARAHFLALLPVRCAYCGTWITGNHELAAAHVVDGDPSFGWQPAHRLCNERAKRRQ